MTGIYFLILGLWCALLAEQLQRRSLAERVKQLEQKLEDLK